MHEVTSSPTKARYLITRPHWQPGGGLEETAEAEGSEYVREAPEKQTELEEEGGSALYPENGLIEWSYCGS